MLIDRFIGCLFLCLCALLWFVIIPQQISGEEQAMYPRLTIIFLAIPALFMALRTTGKNISLEAVAKAFSNPSDSVFPRILFLIVSYAVCIMSTEYQQYHQKFSHTFFSYLTYFSAPIIQIWLDGMVVHPTHATKKGTRHSHFECTVFLWIRIFSLANAIRYSLMPFKMKSTFVPVMAMLPDRAFL